MKKIAILSLALAPLLTGCAGSTLGPRISPEAEQRQTRAVAGLRSQVQKLQRRVRSLNRRIAAQKTVPSSIGSDPSALRELKTRLEDLEAAVRAAGTSAGSAPGQGAVVDLAKKFAALSRQVEQLSEALRETNTKTSSLNASAAARKRVDDRLANLEARLKQLDAEPKPSPAPVSSSQDQALERRLSQIEARLRRLAATPPSPAGSGADQALEQRLLRLEAAQKTTANKLATLEADLEKDRTLVIDFLEDLDNRLVALEKALPGAAPKP